MFSHDCSGKEMRILQYNTERPAQIRFADFVDIDTVIPDLSILQYRRNG